MSRDPTVTHRIMSAIPSKGTKPELILRKALWHENLRYRINFKELPGKPDIVFTKQRVVVFCDGDFWHGHNWAIRGMKNLQEELDNYSDYWREKILRNIERDEENNKALGALGWTVIRIWESDIKRDLDGCVKTVKETLFDQQLTQLEEFELDIRTQEIFGYDVKFNYVKREE